MPIIYKVFGHGRFRVCDPEAEGERKKSSGQIRFSKKKKKKPLWQLQTVHGPYRLQIFGGKPWIFQERHAEAAQRQEGDALNSQIHTEKLKFEPLI